MDKSDSDYTRYQGTRYTVRFRSTLQKEFKKNNPLSYKDRIIALFFDSEKEKERDNKAISYAMERDEIIIENLSNSISKKELYNILEDVYSIDGIKKMISIYEKEKKDVESLLKYLLLNVNKKAREGERSVQSYLENGRIDNILRNLLQNEYPQGSEGTIVYNQGIDHIIDIIKSVVAKYKSNYENYKNNMNFNYHQVKVQYLYPAAKEFALIEIDIKKMSEIQRFLEKEKNRLNIK